MADLGYLSRHQAAIGGQGAKGCLVYVYQSKNVKPPDGRAATAVRVLTEYRAKKVRHSLALDKTSQPADDWPGERCVRKGTASDLPAIPSLAALLARS